MEQPADRLFVCAAAPYHHAESFVSAQQRLEPLIDAWGKILLPEEVIESLPLAKDVLLTVLEFAAEHLEDVPGNARVKAEPAAGVREHLFMKESGDGLEQLVDRRPVLH
ncbi:MAG: hypothetical protein JRS35_03740 [Deltaproteobacteria bacterium]|nr:hypothetical protein [Deltaproteobacteria bacterium]